MPSFFPYRGVAAAGLSLLLAGCSLTSTEVEPDLPQRQLNNDNTLTYRANGLPVVSHNYANLGTILTAVFGDGRPVSAKLRADSTLVVYSYDLQNELPDGGKQHLLSLVLPRFRGRGTYQLQAPATTYQELAVPYQPPQAAPLTVVATQPAQVVVTTWDAASRRLKGTFSLTVAAPGQAQATALTEGYLDLTVDQ